MFDPNEEEPKPNKGRLSVTVVHRRSVFGVPIARIFAHPYRQRPLFNLTAKNMKKLATSNGQQALHCLEGLDLTLSQYLLLG